MWRCIRRSNPSTQSAWCCRAKGLCTNRPPTVHHANACSTVQLSVFCRLCCYVKHAHMNIVSHVAMRTHVRPRTEIERKLRYTSQLGDLTSYAATKRTSSLCFFPSRSMSAISWELPWCSATSFLTASETPKGPSEKSAGCWSSIALSFAIVLARKCKRELISEQRWIGWAYSTWANFLC